MPGPAYETFVLACALVLPLGSLLWLCWEGSVRPRLVPREEIDRLADEAMACHGFSAVEILELEEDHASRYCHWFEAGLLRRVRGEIQRRTKAL